MRFWVVLVAALGVAACGHSGPRAVSASGAGAFEAALAAVGGGFAVAWYDTRDGNGEIYLRRLDADGAPIGPERRLTRSAEESYEPSLAPLGDRVAVAWYDKAADGTLRARLGLFDREGREIWERSLPPGSRNPVLRAGTDLLLAAWIAGDPMGQAETVWAGRFGADGTPAGEPVRLGPASKTTWNLNAALADDGTFWVVWDDESATRASELYLARVGTTGASGVLRLSPDDGVESKYPDVALAGGRAGLTWYEARDGNTDVYVLMVDAAALREDAAARARRVTATRGESIGAYLAWNGDRAGLAWSDDTTGQHEIYFQPIDGDGFPLGGMRQITRNRTASLIPAIVPAGAGFALAWNEFTPGDDGHDGRSEIAFAIVP